MPDMAMKNTKETCFGKNYTQRRTYIILNVSF